MNVQKKETRNEKVVPQKYSHSLFPQLLLFVSFHPIKMSAGEETSCALQLHFLLLNFQLESASSTVPDITYCILSHLKVSYHR